MGGDKRKSLRALPRPSSSGISSNPGAPPLGDPAGTRESSRSSSSSSSSNQVSNYSVSNTTISSVQTLDLPSTSNSSRSSSSRDTRAEDPDESPSTPGRPRSALQHRTGPRQPLRQPSRQPLHGSGSRSLVGQRTKDGAGVRNITGSHPRSSSSSSSSAVPDSPAVDSDASTASPDDGLPWMRVAASRKEQRRLQESALRWMHEAVHGKKNKKHFQKTYCYHEINFHCAQQNARARVEAAKRAFRE
jgi:hypothetical protein